MYHLLVADDSAAELDCIVFLIQKFDFPFQVTSALNGEEALQLMRQNPYDILITDIQMPFLDGLSLTRQSLSIHPGIKTVIISAHEDFSYAKTAITLGVQEYLLKPIDPAELQAILSRILARLEEEQQERRLQNLQLDYVKNHLLLRQIRGEDLDTDSTVLLNTCFQSYSFLLLLELNRSFFATADETFEKEVTGFFPDDCYYLNLTPELSLILFRGETLPEDADLETFLGGLTQMIQNKYGVSAKISFGRVSSPTFLGKVYKRLEELLESAFLYPGRTVFPLELYEEISRDSSVPGLLPSSAGSKIREVKRYIYQNYGGDLSLERLAGMIYVHPDYLSRLFKKETGYNLNQFIKKYRMEKAKEMLVNTRMKVSAIGASVGYSNSSYFCKTFNDYFGMPPEKFREKRGKE